MSRCKRRASHQILVAINDQDLNCGGVELRSRRLPSRGCVRAFPR
jgi:hypothetical protein